MGETEKILVLNRFNQDKNSYEEQVCKIKSKLFGKRNELLIVTYKIIENVKGAGTQEG